jgi:hypothetical protein
MDIARIERRIGVRATPDQIWDLIADLPGWDRWNPVETRLEGAIAFGAEIALTERIGDLPERRPEKMKPLATMQLPGCSSGSISK